ncbi:FG-GAP repeat protein [Stieleria varia]|uniref:FG-GAP repeat protein n=2 Tax=Stieleria varia TaxID=2528005 RepID=A0A5C6A064_9BACT|nr:FG-GAP repeat protein [Stieleria varia]
MLAAEIEPNEATVDATVFVAGDVLEGRLSRTDDVDFFRTTLLQGQRFLIDTFNINAPRFDPTLPPGLEILNDAGETMSTSFDGRDISLVAPSTGQYFVRITSQNAFGTFVGDYGMQSTVNNPATRTEAEPNDSVAQANAAALGQIVNGSINDLIDVDTYIVDAQNGDSIVVAFAGLPQHSPAVTVRTATGQVLGQGSDGNGVAVSVPTGGQIYVTMSSRNTQGNFTGEYSTVINRFADSRVARDVGDSFADADLYRSTDLRETITGVLSNPGDADFYSFEINGIEFLNFSVQASGSEQIVETGKELRLYNQYGQMIRHSSTGQLDTEFTDALVPGRYFIEVLAASPVGTGAYALSYATRTNFSLQRDNAVNYFDFDGTDSYFGFDRVANYAVPAAQDYVVGVFESRYEVYDVETTLTKPLDGNERVASGIGDFGDIGAGGLGGGGRGTRSSQGTAVNSALETSANNISYLTTPTIMHEFGHATGLPHARDAQGLMSYVGSTEYLPVGGAYAFQGTDSRRPGTSVYDVRDYLDWALQPGAQIHRSEQQDSTGPLNLDPFYIEMTLDHSVVALHDTEGRPFDIVTGDFNADGRDDIAVANDVENSISVFLTAADGSLGTPTTVAIGGDITRWTEPLEIGDLDGDGDADLVVAVYGARNVTVLLSNGDGSFANAMTYAVPREPQGLELVDINLDGRLDIVAVTVATQTGYTYLGAGDGTFSAGPNFLTGDNTYSVSSGDFNGDGRIDLVAANANSNTVSLLSGTGSGTFLPLNTLVVGDNPQSVVAADFDGDGLTDFAVASRDERRIDLFRARVGGSFTLNGSLDVPFDPFFLEADDVDGDGVIDLISAGYNTSAQVSLGLGNGQFTRLISLQAGGNEAIAAAIDLDGDGDKEFVVSNEGDNTIAIMEEIADDPRNDRSTVFSAIDDDDDVDTFQLTVTAGSRWTFDIDSAEFQYPLDAMLSIYGSNGQLLTLNDDGLDRNSGIESVDPFISHVFQTDDVVTIEVSGKLGSAGNYRFKVTPQRALDQDGPQINAVFPEYGSTINQTAELVFFFNDVLDPATLTDANISVVGANSGVHTGNVVFNPLDAALIWTADQALPVDSYTVTLNGDVGGITDLAGNLLDGEASSTFGFPQLSGDGATGGSFVMPFTISQLDNAPSQVRDASYLRDPYNRGRFQLNMTDNLSIASVHSAEFTLRGTGQDGLFNTADDTLLPLDATYDHVRQSFNPSLNLYSRGIPDSGRYLIQGTLEDAAGLRVQLNEPISVSGSVPESALFTDAALSSGGLTGSYVNSNLRGYAVEDDWRNSQTISGTRVDPQVAFSRAEFGVRSTVGITGGSADDNWDDFSVQWDGWIQIPTDGIQLVTRSDDGSRMWIDLNGDGNLNSADGELFDNGWGTGHRLLPGQLTPELAAGTYQIRIQYEETTGQEQMHFEWLLPGAPVDVDGFIHGPSVIDVSILPGSHVVTSSSNSVWVAFSGNIDVSTLTPSNLQLRRSPTPTFFDADDVVLVDSDGIIQWDPVTLKATLEFDRPLENGFYLLEANGDVGGITNTAGNLLDGEFLSSYIPGNNNPFIWNNTPSGDGIAGGDYRAAFSIAQPTLAIDVVNSTISEKGGVTAATLSRRFADLSAPMSVTLNISDSTELRTVSRTVIFPAGVESVPITFSAIDDDLLDGTQVVLVTATAIGILSGETEINVTDHETMNMRLSTSSLSEKAGSAVLTITRLDVRGEQTVTLLNSRPDKLSLPSSVTIPDGESTVTVQLMGIDNSILDGNQLATITANTPNMINSLVSIDVTDYEELTVDVIEDSMSERGGLSLATMTRTDPRGGLIATVRGVPGSQLSVPAFVQFLDGQTQSTPFTITAIDNDLLDGTRLVSVVGAAAGYIDGTDTVTITDHEELAFAFGSSTISELGGTTTGYLTRTDPSGDATVTLTSADATRLSVPVTVSFADGHTTSDLFTVSAIDNVLVDGNAAIDVTAQLDGYIDSVASITVQDHEPLSIAVLNEPIFENSGEVRFRLTRPAAGIESVVGLQGSVPQFFSLPSSVTFAESDVSIEFAAAIIDNDVVGVNRSVTVLANSPEYVSTSVTVAVAENDTPQLGLTLMSNQLIEGGTKTTARLTRNTRSEMTVRLDVSIADTLDLPRTIQFPAGRSFLDFEIRTINNDAADGTRDVSLVASAAGHPQVSVDLFVIDDEQPGFHWDTAGVNVVESGLAGTASLVLDVKPVGNVVINLESSDAQQLSLNKTSMTFTPDNWNVPQFLTVTAIDDITTEPNMTLSLIASIDVAASSSAFRSVADQSIPVAVSDNDLPAIVLSETDGSTIVNELGLSDSFALRLQTRPLTDVRLVVDGNRVPDVIFSPTELIFTPDNWDQPQQVEVSTPLDFDIDRNQIGEVFVSVDAAGSDPGYRNATRRILAAVHVDSVLNDLRIRRENASSVILIDETTDQIIRSTPADGTTLSVLNMGTRGERVYVEPISNGGLLFLDTAAGDDTVTLAEYDLGGIDGGLGNDTLIAVKPNATIRFDDSATGKWSNIERIDLSTSTSQSAVFSAPGVVAATDARNTLHVIASTGEQLSFVGSWSFETPVVIDGRMTHVLASQGAVIQLTNGSIWQNPVNHFDVDGGGDVTSLDALMIVNRLAQQASSELPGSPEPNNGDLFYDTNADGLATALDALNVINELAAQRARLSGELVEGHDASRVSIIDSSLSRVMEELDDENRDDEWSWQLF